MLNCLFFRIFSSVRMKWVWASARYLAFGRTPGHRRLAKCDAGSFVGTSSISFASARARKLIHFAAPPLKIAIALLDCDFVFFAHVGATLAFPVAPRIHSQAGQKAAHSGDTRLTSANGACCGRVQGCKQLKALPLTLLLRQAPEPLVGAALRKNAEISLCDFQRPL